MDFELTEDQRAFRDLAREFAQDRLAPVAAEQDEREEFPHQEYRAAAKLGFFGLLVPEEYGGVGADTATYAAVVEEISRAHAAFSIPVSVHNSLVCYPLSRWGTEEQKQRYLPRLASGDLLGGFALTEAASGSDASAMRTTARKNGNDWLITGGKIFVSQGATGSLFLVFAVTNPDAERPSRAASAFLVERGTEGFSTGRKETKMGMRSSDTTELTFQAARVPAGNMLGAEGDGLKIALSALDGGRIGIAAQAVGIAQAALDLAARYAMQREQFGQPIVNFQANQFKLADMATETEAARLLTMEAAYLKDAGLPFSRQSAMCKLAASQAAVRAADMAVQVHGGYGYIKEYPVERLYRDAKVTEIYEGTSEIQRLVIADSVITSAGV